MCRDRGLSASIRWAWAVSSNLDGFQKTSRMSTGGGRRCGRFATDRLMADRPHRQSDRLHQDICVRVENNDAVERRGAAALSGRHSDTLGVVDWTDGVGSRLTVHVSRWSYCVIRRWSCRTPCTSELIRSRAIDARRHEPRPAGSGNRVRDLTCQDLVRRSTSASNRARPTASAAASLRGS